MLKRSILFKMIFAFLVVSLITVGLLVASASYNTGKVFDTYLMEKDQESITNHFAQYYTQHGSWDGVAATLDSLYTTLKVTEGDAKHPSFSLADSQDIVIISGGYYNVGDQLLQNDKKDSQVIRIDGKVAGYLVFRRPMPRPNPGPNGFIERVNTRLILSGVAALVFALLLGIVISRIFTRPIRDLTDAARKVANGNLKQQVVVRSSDEMGELTVVFNDMTAKLSQLIDSRKQMTADIAHELRTPISVILGHAEGIHDGVLEASPETIEIIRHESIRLEKLVNDLRVLALSDAGELKLAPLPSSPVSLLQTVHNIFRYKAQSKEIELELDYPEQISDVMIDTDRMVQVFSNLVENALRVTPRGGVIRLKAIEQDHQVEFIVSDTGPGLPEGESDKIFDRLYRTDQSRQRDQGGSGLGLAIARTLVEQQGGKIWAESVPGEGASMHIQLPTYTRPN
jgi:signal transduction histidine kinase